MKPRNCGRGRSRIESPRPLRCTLAALLAIAISAGCDERDWAGQFERWPAAVAMHEGAPVVARAGGPSTVAVGSAATIQVGNPITSIASSPRDGFFVFCAPTLLQVRHHDGAWGLRDSSPIEHTVRQALPLQSGRLALLTAGDIRGRLEAPPAEPAPWLREGLIRLAWLDGEALTVGEPQLGPEINPYRIKSGRFGGEAENLLVFVYTRAPFDEVMRPRPWIYRIIEGDGGTPYLEPRWRGTSFSRPFRDAVFGDFTGDGEGEIAALEVAREGGRLLTAYRFKGFGLEGLAPSVQPPEVEDRVEVLHRVEGADQLVVRTTDGRFLLFSLDTDADELRETGVIEGPKDPLVWMIVGESTAAGPALLCVLPDGGLWRSEVGQ